MANKPEPIDPELLSLFACPACENRPPVCQQGETLVCTQCGRIYPIREGIPVLLVEEATLPESAKNPSGKSKPKS